MADVASQRGPHEPGFAFAVLHRHCGLADGHADNCGPAPSERVEPPGSVAVPLQEFEFHCVPCEGYNPFKRRDNERKQPCVVCGIPTRWSQPVRRAAPSAATEEPATCACPPNCCNDTLAPNCRLAKTDPAEHAINVAWAKMAPPEPPPREREDDLYLDLVREVRAARNDYDDERDGQENEYIAGRLMDIVLRYAREVHPKEEAPGEVAPGLHGDGGGPNTNGTAQGLVPESNRGAVPGVAAAPPQVQEATGSRGGAVFDAERFYKENVLAWPSGWTLEERNIEIVRMAHGFGVADGLAAHGPAVPPPASVPEEPRPSDHEARAKRLGLCPKCEHGHEGVPCALCPCGAPLTTVAPETPPKMTPAAAVLMVTCPNCGAARGAWCTRTQDDKPAACAQREAEGRRWLQDPHGYKPAEPGPRRPPESSDPTEARVQRILATQTSGDVGLEVTRAIAARGPATTKPGSLWTTAAPTGPVTGLKVDPSVTADEVRAAVAAVAPRAAAFSGASPAPLPGERTPRERAHAMLVGFGVGFKDGNPTGQVFTAQSLSLLVDRLTANEEAHDRALKEANERAEHWRLSHVGACDALHEQAEAAHAEWKKVVTERDSLASRLRESEERREWLAHERDEARTAREKAEAESARLSRDVERLTSALQQVVPLRPREHDTDWGRGWRACIAHIIAQSPDSVRFALSESPGTGRGET